MIVYHGSTEIIQKPDVLHSKKYLDCRSGFYVTTFEKQAEKNMDAKYLAEDLIENEPELLR